MGDREEIEALDSRMARLKVEYEQYFARVLKREPLQLREELDRAVLALSNRTINNTAARFKLNTLVSRYNSCKQHWNRVLRAIEEGTYVRKSEGVEAGAIQSRAKPAAARAVRPPDREPAAKGTGKDPIEELYGRYIEARKQCHEPTEGITPEGLRKTIEQYRKKVEEQYKTSEVELKVAIKDGKARLTMTPKKKAG